MITVLDSIDYFQPGQLMRFPENENLLKYQRWYANDFNTLWSTSTIENGHVQVTGSELKIPLFELASNFVGNAVLGEMPAHNAEDVATEEWLDANRRMIDDALRKATRYWGVSDFAVFTAEPGRIYAVDPAAYFRVGLPDQPDIEVGHILAHRWRDRSEDDRKLGLVQRNPNRITVLKFYDGRSSVQTFAFTGNNLGGGVVGNALTPEMTTPITQVCVAGSGDSWYGGAQNIAESIILEASNIRRDLNRYRNRITWLPAGISDTLRNELREQNRPATLSAIKAEIEKLVNPVITLDATEEPPLESAVELQLEAAFQFFRTQLDTFFITSGVPPSSFGIGIGRGESGFAREKAQDASTSRSRTYRTHLEDCLPLLVRAASGREEGKIHFTWVTQPFQDRSKYQDDQLALLGAGVLDVDEVRVNLGYGKRETTGEPAQEPSTNEPREEQNVNDLQRSTNQ